MGPDVTLFTQYRDTVKPEWIDANNYMNVACFVLTFDLASDAFLTEIGSGADYIKEQGKSFFIVEMNVSYKQEMCKGAPLFCNTQLIGLAANKIHLFHRMYHEVEGYLAATNEILLLHVNMATRRSISMGKSKYKALSLISGKHKEIALPDNLSRQLKV